MFRPFLKDFDLETEVGIALSNAHVASGGLYTDTGQYDIGRIFISTVLSHFASELVDAHPYLLENYMYALGELLGIEPPPPSKARGYIMVWLDAGAVVPVGSIFVATRNGQRYASVFPVATGASGYQRVEIEAVTAGSLGNQKSGSNWSAEAGSVGSRADIQNPSSIGGGSESMTLEQYKEWLPKQIENNTIVRQDQFEAVALSFGWVGKVSIFRQTKPANGGGYKRQVGSFVAVLTPKHGVLAPDLSAVKQAMVDKTMLTMADSIYVVSSKGKPTSVIATVAKSDGYSDSKVRQAVDLACQKFFDTFSGGQDGKGLRLGERVKMFELGAAIEALPEVHHVIGLDIGDGGQISIDDLPELQTVTTNVFSLPEALNL